MTNANIGGVQLDIDCLHVESEFIGTGNGWFTARLPIGVKVKPGEADTLQGQPIRITHRRETSVTVFGRAQPITFAFEFKPTAKI